MVDQSLTEDEDRMEYYNVKRIVTHKDFNPSDFEYDFGIIKLMKPVTGSKLIRLVMNLPPVDKNKLVGKFVSTQGWDMNESTQQPTSVRETILEIISNSLCQVILRRSKELTVNHICGFNVQNDFVTCHRDGGGKSATIY